MTSTYRDLVLEKRYRWQQAGLLLVGSRSSDSVARFDMTDVRRYETHVQQNSASELESARTYSVHSDHEGTAIAKSKQANQAHVRKREKKKWIQHRAVPGWSPTPVLSGPKPL